MGALMSPPMMKIVKRLWIVQGHDWPAAIFRPVSPNAKMISWPAINAKSAAATLRSAPCSESHPIAAAAAMNPIR
jgi:hypothetical protein